jgi:hypothetical protein
MRAPHWKQGSPRDQVIQITSGIEGWLSNLEDGTSTPARVLEHILPMIQDLKRLAQEEMPTQWTPTTPTIYDDPDHQGDPDYTP